MSTNGRPYDHRQAFDIVETPSTDAIESLITRTRRLLRSTWTTTGLATTCGIFLSALLFVTVVDLAMPLSRFFRTTGWLVVFVSGTAAFVTGVVIPLLRRLTAIKVANKIESHLPGIHNRLVSCVELTGDSEAATRAPVFHRRLVTEALERIRGFQPKSVLDLQLLRRAAMFAGGGLAAFVLAALIFGDRMPTAVARIVNPLADIPPNSGVVYDVLIADRREPGDCDILRGEDVAFTVVLRKGQVDPPGGTDPLRLELNVADEEGSRRRVWYDFGQVRDNRVSLSLNDMQQPCSYRVHGGGTWSKQYSINLLDRPRITAVRSALHFPEYMRIEQPQVSNDDDVDVTGPLGSRVEIFVSFEGDVSEGEIELLAPSADGELAVVERVAMQSSHHAPRDESGAATGKSFAEHSREPGHSPSNAGNSQAEREGYFGSFGLKQDGFYRIVLRNSLGYANRRMKEGQLTAVPDNPPQVVLARPTEDIVVTSPLEIPVQVAAFDDFGIDDISLIVEHSYWGETRQAHPFTTGRPPRAEDVLFVLDLAEQRLRRNDRIECRVEARDTKGQIAVSESFSVRVANEREAADRELVDLQEQMDAVASMLDSLIREQNRADEIISELAMTEAEPADRVEGDNPEQDNPFAEQGWADAGDEDLWEREREERVDNGDDIWERDQELAELTRIEQQNVRLAEQLAEALREAAEQAADAQLLPTEIAEQIAAAEQAIEPTVQQPLEQLQEMVEQMGQQANREQAPRTQPAAHRAQAEQAEQAVAAERVSDHLQDNLEDLQARLEAIQQAQEESQNDIEQALANFEQELTEQNATAAARELSELSDFVNELREDLQQDQDRQTELTAQNNQPLSEPAFDALADQQEAFEQQAQEDLNQARELLNSDPIDDLAQEAGDRENGNSDSPFEPIQEDAGTNDDLWEEAGEPEAGRREENERWQDEAFDSKSKEPSFKPAIDGSKKGFEEPSGEEHGEAFGEESGAQEPAGQEPGSQHGEEAGGEESETWEDAFEGAAEEGESNEGRSPAGQSPRSENGRPNESEAGRPEASSSDPGTSPPSASDPRARLAQQQQQHAEQLDSAAASLAADQQTLDELVSELSENVSSASANGPSNAQSAQQLSQLLNSPAMQQAMAMQQRMNAMQLPPSLARSATAQLTQSQGSPEGARTMSGAVEQILVELGETDPQAASLLMRMQPHQREDLLQGLRQGGPKGYRKFIRDYFIRLSQAGARRE